MGKLNWGMKACGIFLLWAGTAVALPAGTLTTLHPFAGAPGDGANPYAGLIQVGALFYGTTTTGGLYNEGMVFSMTAAGAVTPLYNFCPVAGCADGANPYGGLTMVGGDFFGTTYAGGANNLGTIFKLSLLPTPLYSFTGVGPDGANPVGGLILASNNYFYGTASNGGTSGDGMIFKVEHIATYPYTPLTSFNGTNGANPMAALLQVGTSTPPTLYGTTLNGGAHGVGAVFEYHAGVTVLHSFDVTDGDLPYAPLVGTKILYGTTSEGGTGGYGTVFSITLSGTLTTLHNFNGVGADGRFSYAGLLLDGTHLIGTTTGGGLNLTGTIFTITTSGSGFTTIENFAGFPTNGGRPTAGLILDGTFLYGTTFYGGSSSNCSLGCGTTFKWGPI